ncbi:unnamed protein product, partial [Cylindrotheca closterium]
PDISMARKKKLRPGPGAIAEVLAKFIKPVKPVPGPKHRSTVILQEEKAITCSFLENLVNQEPNIEWRHSKARRILVEDVKKGVIKFDDDNKLWVHGHDSSSRQMAINHSNAEVMDNFDDENIFAHYALVFPPETVLSIDCLDMHEYDRRQKILPMAPIGALTEVAPLLVKLGTSRTMITFNGRCFVETVRAFALRKQLLPGAPELQTCFGIHRL